MSTVAISFLRDKYYPIMDLLDLKDLSRKLQKNCVISYFLSIFNAPCMCYCWKNAHCTPQQHVKREPFHSVP